MPRSASCTQRRAAPPWALGRHAGAASALLLLCACASQLVAQPAAGERLVVRYRPGMQDQVRAPQGHHRLAPGPGHTPLPCSASTRIRGRHTTAPAQVRQSLLAAGYTIRVDISQGSAFAVDKPGSGSGGVGDIKRGMALNPQLSGPEASAAGGPANAPDAGGAAAGAEADEQPSPQPGGAPLEGGSLHLMSTAAAMSALSALPGIVDVQPDRKIYLLQGRHGQPGSGQAAQRRALQQLEQQRVLQPQNACLEQRLFSMQDFNGSVEYTPYGVGKVQALDPAVLQASKGIGSRVRGPALLPALLPVLRAACCSTAKPKQIDACAHLRSTCHRTGALLHRGLWSGRRQPAGPGRS
jgi:hypothetical protein